MQRATWNHAIVRAAAMVVVGIMVGEATMRQLAAQQQQPQQPRQRNNTGQGNNNGQGNGQNNGQGGNNRRPTVELPDDPKLLELHKNFVLAAEKLAGDYERTNQHDKARSCYSEILRLVPTYTPAAEKLAKIKEKELTAEKKLVDVYANKGWQDSGIQVIAGRPISLRSNGQWTLKMTYNLQADGLEIPKELRDFPLGALIGLIGDSVDDKDAKPFFIGADKTFDATKSGKLYLRIYDSDPEDNLGRIGVIVEGSFNK
ncbi:MAG: hypothetical protein K8U03_01590 [Planctomycetia bacterium]|nr:hypothetical protein [Planctomycetia bacterium]